jgi:plastocyanin
MRRVRRPGIRLCVAAAWLGTAAVCSPAVAQSSNATPTATATANVNAIKIDVRNFMFGPQTLTVTAGSTVVWTNLDQEPHTIASDQGLFRSGAIDTHETFSFKFDHPGTYRYFCTIHPQMLGTIVVQ